MVNPQPNRPTIEELVTKALRANVIDHEFAGDLRNSADLEEALGMFYTYALEYGDDPEALLTKWGVIEPNSTTEPEEADNRLLREGMDVTYTALVGELSEDEVLVAVWRGGPASSSKVRRVVNYSEFTSTVSEVRSDYNSPATRALPLIRSSRDIVRWFASKTGSENPIDYDMFD